MLSSTVFFSTDLQTVRLESCLTQDSFFLSWTNFKIFGSRWLSQELSRSWSQCIQLNWIHDYGILRQGLNLQRVWMDCKSNLMCLVIISCGAKGRLQRVCDTTAPAGTDSQRNAPYSPFLKVNKLCHVIPGLTCHKKGCPALLPFLCPGHGVILVTQANEA